MLFFPEHNQSIFLGAYRSLVLAERWYKKVDSMELLAVVCEHLFELTPEWRGVIALQIYRRFIFPILQAILALEEELLDTDGSMLKIPTEIAKRNQILSLMGEAVLFKSFTGLVTEILNYVLEIIPQNTAKYEGSIADLSSIPLHLSSVYNLAQGSSNSPVMYEEDVSYLAFRDSTDLYMERLSSNASNTGGGTVPSPTAASGGSSNSISQVSPTLNGLSWPVLADKYMSDMFVAFYTPHFASTHATNNTESGAKGNASKAPSTPFPSSSRHNRKAVAKEDMIWSDKSTTREIMLYHIAVFYVMQLRFQCGLRGLKPSQLLGKHPLQEIITTNRMYGMSISKTSQLDRFDEDWRQMRLNQFVVDDVLHIRTEFLAQGFMRLANVEFPAVLYTLATSLWGFDTDTIRLLHIRALLTNGDHDNEIEEMVPQVSTSLGFYVPDCCHLSLMTSLLLFLV